MDVSPKTAITLSSSVVLLRVQDSQDRKEQIQDIEVECNLHKSAIVQPLIAVDLPQQRSPPQRDSVE